MGAQEPRAKRGFGFLPQTRFGRYAFGLLALGLVGLQAVTLAVNAFDQSGGTNPWIILTLGPAVIAVILGGFVAAYAIVREHERGVLTAIPLLIGLFVALFLLGEITTPH